MKIAILSRAPRCYSTKRILEAAISRGHEVDVLDTSRFSILLEQRRPSLFYDGEPLKQFDAIIPRIGATITFFGTAVVRQFEQMGVFCLNGSEAIVDTRDKLRTMQLLSRHDIGIPPTALVRRNKHILPAIGSVGGVPVVLKLIQGTQGVGVILAETIKMAESIIETLRSARQNVLIQKFVSESRGRDIRAFVVGDRVVAAMRRIAPEAEFRSNVHRGASPEPVALDPVYEQTAIRTARIVGLHVAGVDMLEGQNGPQVAEVNNSPGLQGIESATNIDIAGEIIRYLESQVSEMQADTPTAQSVNGVAEVVVSDQSSLVGQTIVDSHLPGRDLIVLRLRRPGTDAAEINGGGAIRPGDRLLCYGRIEELSAIAPDQITPASTHAGDDRSAKRRSNAAHGRH